MRSALLLILFGVAALSGCVSDDDTTDDSGSDAPLDSDSDGFTDAQEEAAGSDPADAASTPKIPEALTYTGSLKGVGDVSREVPCTFQDMTCETHDVPIPDGRWRVTFTLTPIDGMATSQGFPYRSDYELIVLGQESTNAPGEKEVISGVIQGPTSETAEIQAWHDVDGSYELLVEFALP